MAATKIADVIEPSVFNPYVIERTAELSALWTSGVVSTNPEIQARVNGGSRLINMPFWTDLTGDDEVLADDTALTPGAIGTDMDVACKHFRGKAWGVNDLAKSLSGDDPMGAIADLVAAYWARRMQVMLINTLAGVFADNIANDAGDMVKDIHEADVDTDGAKLIGADSIIDTLGTMGDAWEKLAAIMMHSVPFRTLQKADLITYEEIAAADVSGTASIVAQSAGYTGASTKSLKIPYYLGKRIIVDDGCPAVAAATSGMKYTSYFFGAGAVGWADAALDEATETDRDKLAGEDYLIHRRHYILHPRGIKWLDDTKAGVGPTNAECALAANWNRVYERKNIRIAALITNG